MCQAQGRAPGSQLAGKLPLALKKFPSPCVFLNGPIAIHSQTDLMSAQEVPRRVPSLYLMGTHMTAAAPPGHPGPRLGDVCGYQTGGAPSMEGVGHPQRPLEHRQPRGEGASLSPLSLSSPTFLASSVTTLCWTRQGFVWLGSAFVIPDTIFI